MYPHVDTVPFDGTIRANMVFDMVYNPPTTRLLRLASDQGKTIIRGTTMFLAQSGPACRHLRKSLLRTPHDRCHFSYSGKHVQSGGWV
jgi:shikimate 5-dehydrogenase